MQQPNYTVEDFLERGISFSYKSLSLNNLSKVRQFPFILKFQVDSRDFTKIYSDPKEAIDKFLEIQKKMR